MKLIGKTLAHYKVTDQIGSGGMGEVYRAHDTKLDRQVAIKIVPDALSHEPERLTRFEREAKLLASLNHPHIATIFGLEKDDGRHFIVMELIEGEDLGERLRRGRLDVKEAIRIGAQVADALAAAHDQGIVHRDLKPANIKLNENGDAKVLDFGLAKATEGDPGDSRISQSPTVTAGGTTQGVILGTAAYMSPEQARGKPVDKRTDVWAFGCVLHEMLTGHLTFAGETVSDTIARILEREPDWSALPDSTPRRVRRLLERCLAKDMKRRLRDISDVRVELEDTLSETDASDMTVVSRRESQSGNRRGLALGLLIGAVVTAIAMTLSGRDEAVTGSPVTHASFTVPEDVEPAADADVQISPDGRMIAFQAYAGEPTVLYVRDLSETTSRLLLDGGARAPFFSPDGKWIACIRSASPRNELVRVPVGGGTARVLCDLEGIGPGVWSENGNIVIPITVEGGLSVVSAAGDGTRQLTRPDTASGEFGHWSPWILPDNDHVLFTAWKTNLDDAVIKVVSIKTGETRVILNNGLRPMYMPTGHLLYTLRTSLVAVPFDLETLTASGEPVPVMDPAPVDVTSGMVEAFVSQNGTLVYQQANEYKAKLQWLGLDGSVEDILPVEHDFDAIDISPDGDRIVTDIDKDGNSDIYVIDVNNKTMLPITFDGLNNGPIFSPDGKSISFQTMRRGPFEVFTKSANGSGEARPLFELDTGEAWPIQWYPDGSRLLVSRWPFDTGVDIYTYEPSTGKHESIVQSPFSDYNASVSPNGKWLTYESRIDGQRSIFLVSSDLTGPRLSVGPAGAAGVRWSPNSEALYFWIGEDIHRVHVQTDPSLVVGESEVVVPARQHGGRVGDYDIHPDGKRFAAVVNPPNDRSIYLTFNWFNELNRLVPIAD